MTSYDAYHREYYQKNKAKILKKTRAYRKIYNKLWYQKNRERLLAKAAERRMKARVVRILTDQDFKPYKKKVLDIQS